MFSYMRVASVNPVMLFEVLHVIERFIAVGEITHEFFATSTVMCLNVCVEIGFPSKDSIRISLREW